LELASQGLNQSEISRTLQISQPTINRDLSYLRQQAKQNIRKYIDERLPEEYEKCLVGLNSIVKEAWSTSQQTQDRREKIQALSLAKDCYAMKLDLLTNATVVDDAIRFVSVHGKPTTSIFLENRMMVGEKKSKINTIEETRETDYFQQPPNFTTNQVF
jgi:hypothetical protein